MKRNIIAYLYPKPEEVDEYLRRKDFDARRHISPDDTEAHVPSMNDGMARAIEEVFGLPQGALQIVDAGSDGGDLGFFVGLSDYAQDLRDLPLGPVELGTALHRYLERYVPDNPHEFIWKSHSGKTYPVSKMASKHIFYALRMLFNHTVPPVFRVLGPGEVINRYPDVPHWSPAYRQAAISAFTNELNERDDLEGSLKFQFEDMKANTQAILALGL